MKSGSKGEETCLIVGIRITTSDQISSDIAASLSAEEIHEPLEVEDESGNLPNFDAKVKDRQDTPGTQEVLRKHKQKLERYEGDIKVQKHNSSLSKDNGRKKPPIKANSTSSDETSFEEYEREFLLNQINNMLEQFLLFDNFRNELKQKNPVNAKTYPVKIIKIPSGETTQTADTQQSVTPTSAVRTDAGIVNMTRELNLMDMSQLCHVFGFLKESSLQGKVDEGIASLCCPLG